MYIFDIKRYAINDGPGIRTTIFLKGCPLRCLWCHNPEGWSSERELIYKKNKCIGCGTCVATCPKGKLELTSEGVRLKSPTLIPNLMLLSFAANERMCGDCSLCTDACPTLALEMYGKAYTMDALMAEIEKERAVMEQSGGGVTLCGGEPLMHGDFTLELLRELGRRGFHRTVDTSLFAPWALVRQVIDVCELMLIDLKMIDSKRHQFYTGVDNELILSNIVDVARHSEREYWIRIPLIEGVNADDENILETAAFLSSLPRKPQIVNILPYHSLGEEKHRRMWSKYNPDGCSMAVPSTECQEHCQELFRRHGIETVIGG